MIAPARPLVHLLLVNVGVDPQASLTERGFHKLSGRHDSLGFSGGRDNLVATIEQVSMNSWQEVSLQRYVTGDALVQCLKNMLALVARDPARPPRVEVWCAAGSHATAITRRIRELVEDVTRQFFAGGTGPHPVRYLLRVDQRWFVLRFDGREPGFIGLPSDQSLMDYLARPQGQYSPVVPDRYALQDDPAFNEVCRACQPDVVQMFWQQAGPWVRFWVSDETGSLYGWRQRRTGSRRQSLLPLMRFLENLGERRQLRQMAGALAKKRNCCALKLSWSEAVAASSVRRWPPNHWRSGVWNYRPWVFSRAMAAWPSTYFATTRHSPLRTTVTARCEPSWTMSVGVAAVTSRTRSTSQTCIFPTTWIPMCGSRSCKPVSTSGTATSSSNPLSRQRDTDNRSTRTVRCSLWERPVRYTSPFNKWCGRGLQKVAAR